MKCWLQMIERHTGIQTILYNKKTQRNTFTLENMTISSEQSTISFCVVISHPHYDTVFPDRVLQVALKENGLQEEIPGKWPSGKGPGAAG